MALTGVAAWLAPAPNTAHAAGLTAADVQRVIQQGVAEAEAIGLPVAIVVVDLEGNILGGFRMEGVCPDAAACSGPRVDGRPSLKESGPNAMGLEGLVVPAIAASSDLGQALGLTADVSGATLAAISKAGTPAFFSTRGNAFSTRSASFIVQQNFPPGVTDAPSGPLFGVQFSQLLCSDVNAKLPLGLSADPGGLPLYRGRKAIGGVGVKSSSRAYTADLDPTDLDVTPEERIALAATRGFETPSEIRGDRIYVGGLRLPFRNLESVRKRPLTDFAALPGVLEFPVRDAQPSKIQKAKLGGVRGGILVDVAGQNRFPIIDSVNPPVADGGLTAKNVRRILGQGARQADVTRAGIRRPIGDRARVNVAVVDLDGRILGFFRTQDAPIFGIDVSVQKARSAVFFSATDAGDRLRTEGAARAARGFEFGDNLSVFVNAAAADGIHLNGKVAFSDRAIGFISRPFFPDGIHSTRHGPFSRPSELFTVFNDGLQIELALEVLTQILGGEVPTNGCTNVPGLQNGAQIFPGSVPLYRGRRLVGAVGVSGDGVDQDDITAAAGSRGFEAPEDLRADRKIVREVRLPYVKFPRRPTKR